MEIIRGRIPCAKKIVIYGPEGIGKSTFASRFPDPVFIDTEGSTNAMDVARFPKATSWQMLLEQVDYTRRTPGVCKTLVIDTIDWAESTFIVLHQPAFLLEHTEVLCSFLINTFVMLIRTDGKIYFRLDDMI